MVCGHSAGADRLVRSPCQNRIRKENVFNSLSPTFVVPMTMLSRRSWYPPGAGPTASRLSAPAEQQPVHCLPHRMAAPLWKEISCRTHFSVSSKLPRVLYTSRCAAPAGFAVPGEVFTSEPFTTSSTIPSGIDRTHIDTLYVSCGSSCKPSHCRCFQQYCVTSRTGLIKRLSACHSMKCCIGSANPREPADSVVMRTGLRVAVQTAAR